MPSCSAKAHAGARWSSYILRATRKHAAYNRWTIAAVTGRRFAYRPASTRATRSTASSQRATRCSAVAQSSREQRGAAVRLWNTVEQVVSGTADAAGEESRRRNRDVVDVGVGVVAAVVVVVIAVCSAHDLGSERRLRGAKGDSRQHRVSKALKQSVTLAREESKGICGLELI
jgi:hypothetical protein